MGEKKITNTRLDEFKTRVEQMREEYKTDKESFVEKMRSLSVSKEVPRSTENKQIIGGEELKLWVSKEQMQDLINKSRENK